jgi:hypothetical protein
MNVHVRSIAVAALAALASGLSPLAAQSSAQPDLREPPAAFAAVGVMPTGLVDSVTAVASKPATDSAATDSAKTVVRGPSLASARVASRVATTSRGAPPVIQNKSSNRNAVALMIVGGAALVIGAVIGNDAGTFVMLGGAAIGLYGLYLFLT